MAGNNRGRGRNKRQQKDYQNMVGWENRRGEYTISGNISFSPSFLREVLERWEDEDPDVEDSYDPERISLRFTLRDSDYDGTDYFGNVYIGEDSQSRGRGQNRGGGRRTKR